MSKGIPIDGEKNPNHPVTQMAREQWHKIAALLMWHFEIDSFEVTTDMIQKFMATENAIVLDTRNQRMIVRMVGAEEAERLAREAGGLPI